MRKIAMWLINNIPLGKLAPHIFGYAIGATSWAKVSKYENKKSSRRYS